MQIKHNFKTFPISLVPLPLFNDATMDNAISSPLRCATRCVTNDANPRTPTVRTYAYTALTTTAMRGTSNQESKVEIAATVEVAQAGGCDYVMKVQRIDRIYIEFQCDLQCMQYVDTKLDSFSASLFISLLLFNKSVIYKLPLFHRLMKSLCTYS